MTAPPATSSGWKLRRFPEALKAYQLRFDLDPGKEDSISKMADVHQGMGDRRAAASLLAKINTITKRHGEVTS